MQMISDFFYMLLTNIQVRQYRNNPEFQALLREAINRTRQHIEEDPTYLNISDERCRYVASLWRNFSEYLISNLNANEGLVRSAQTKIDFWENRTLRTNGGTYNHGEIVSRINELEKLLL